MKTSKLLSIVMMFALVLGTAMTFSSCSDDDYHYDKKDLVGKWKCSYGDGCYDMFTFKADGTGTYFNYDGDDYSDSDTFDWTYDDTNSILTLMWDDEEGQYRETYEIAWVNSKKIYFDREYEEYDRPYQKQ